jgi:hypothetical protein
MDDVIKTIIATISGFVVAFFADPIKLCFQNEHQKRIFQLALYGEIAHNYRLLSALLKVYREDNPNQVKGFFEGSGKDSMRTDCYSRLSSQSPEIYYQLKESTIINTLYAYLLTATDPEIYSKNDFAKFHLSVESFVLLVEEHVARNELNQRIMKKVSRKGDVKYIIESFGKRYKSK